jgi:DNA-binding transcriptional MerR regulator
MAVLKENGKPIGLKISELAKLADVSIPTIKHYLKEGLLPRPFKTGRTMSYYDPECVKRLRLIRRLQSEKFLPLGVIKGIIESGKPLEDELALGEAFIGIPSMDSEPKTLGEDEIISKTGYSQDILAIFEKNGLVFPRDTDQGKEYDTFDLRIMMLIREREDAGISLSYSIQMMSIYRKYIKMIVREDSRLFLREIIRNKDANEVLQYIRDGSQSLNAFMPLIKEKLMRNSARLAIEELNHAPEEIEEALRFRYFPNVWKSINDTDDFLDQQSPLREVIFWALGENPASLSNHGITRLTIFHLVSGIYALALRRGEEALSYFGKVDHKGPLGCLVQSLSGMAYLILGSESTGFLPIIDYMREAVIVFESSRIETPLRNVECLAAYFRGIGLSIIPDIFDTHEEGKRNLGLAITIARMEGAPPDKNIKRFMNELILKSSYFLTLAHLGNKEYQAAKEILTAMGEKHEGGFYVRWASKKLAEIAGLEGGVTAP